MRDIIKAIGLWTGFVIVGNLMAAAFVWLAAAISDALQVTVPGLPGQAPAPLSEHLFLGLAGFLALFNVLMAAVLLLLLMWLVGSLVGLLINTVRHLYFKSGQTTGA